MLRHAGANNAHVQATIAGEVLAIEISDDGGGFPADNVFGRGLTGMHERVRALSGSLSLLRARRTNLCALSPAGRDGARRSRQPASSTHHRHAESARAGSHIVL